jgi:hypothetical protein
MNLTFHRLHLWLRSPLTLASPPNRPRTTTFNSLRTLLRRQVPHPPNPRKKLVPNPPKPGKPPVYTPVSLSPNRKKARFDDFRKPLKRVGLAIAMLFITGLLISLIVNAIAGLLRGTPPPSQVSMPVAASPKVLPGKEVAKDNADRNACTDIPTKMKAAQISSKQVDRVFWQKHPDRANKTLDLSSATDRTLRQEWCQIAGDLAAPKP